MMLMRGLIGILLFGLVISACSRDMQEQPSFAPQKAPRDEAQFFVDQRHQPFQRLPVSVPPFD